jgi:hypothetical protein
VHFGKVSALLIPRPVGAMPVNGTELPIRHVKASVAIGVKRTFSEPSPISSLFDILPISALMLRQDNIGPEMPLTRIEDATLAFSKAQ